MDQLYSYFLTLIRIRTNHKTNFAGQLILDLLDRFHGVWLLRFNFFSGCPTTPVRGLVRDRDGAKSADDDKSNCSEMVSVIVNQLTTLYLCALD